MCLAVSPSLPPLLSSPFLFIHIIFQFVFYPLRFLHLPSRPSSAQSGLNGLHVTCMLSRLLLHTLVLKRMTSQHVKASFSLSTEQNIYIYILSYFSFVSQCQQYHVQANGGRPQRCHPLPVVGRDPKLSLRQLPDVLCRQPGRLGGQEAGVGAVGEAWLRGEPSWEHSDSSAFSFNPNL